MEEVGDIQAQQEAIRNVVKARSNKFIRRLSVAYPEQEGDLLSRIRVSTMMRVAEYCDVTTQNILSSVNKYFNSLIRTTRTTADINCQPGWVDAINRSPFLKTIALWRESTPEDTKRFCRIVKNDGFPELTDMKLVYMDDNSLHMILSALNTKINRSLRLNIMSPSFTAGVTIAVYDVSQRLCYAFAEAAQESLCHVLGRFKLITSDIDGVENFFKTVDFSGFSLLDEIVLSSCPLQRRGFEFFIRSMWPEGLSGSSLAPVRILRLDDCQIHNSGMVSLTQVMRRGLFANLEVFDISSNKISEKGIRLLGETLRGFACPKLKVLNLTDNFISVGNLVPLFDALAEGACPLLSEIEFGHTGISEEDLAAFTRFMLTPNAENVSRVNFSNNPQITGALPAFFKALQGSPCESIKTLLMEGVSFSLVEVQALTEWLLSGKAAQLKAMVLRSNLLDEESFCLLLNTLINPKCPRISVIDFSSNLIGSFKEERWLQLLAQDGEEVFFEQIDYGFNPLTDNDMRLFLMFMSRFSPLERTARVGFASNLISAETLSYYFRALPDGPCCLNFLAIDSCSIQGCGRYLYEFLSTDASRNLTSLSLRDCGLTKEDVFLLLDGFDKQVCTKLLSLRLDGNPSIDDSFVSRFIVSYGERSSFPNLSRLDAGYTEIDADGVMTLIDFLKENQGIRLQSIDFTSIKVTSEEKGMLKGEMENCYSVHLSLWRVCWETVSSNRSFSSL